MNADVLFQFSEPVLNGDGATVRMVSIEKRQFRDRVRTAEFWEELTLAREGDAWKVTGRKFLGRS